MATKPKGVWRKPSSSVSGGDSRAAPEVEHLKKAEPLKIIYEFHITIDNLNAGKIKVQLNEKTTPLTVQHFIKNIQNYTGSNCNRLKKDGWLQFDVKTPVAEPEIIAGLIYYKRESSQPNPLDENFILPHERGTLALVNAGPNSNSTAFMILLNPIDYFHQKYVAFGQVIEGWETLDMVNKVTTTFDVPNVEIGIEKVEKITTTTDHHVIIE